MVDSNVGDTGVLKYYIADLISCTLHFGFNYEINYQLDAIEYLFALSSFSSTCFGLTRPSSGAIGVTISYICSIWCPWF